MKAALGMMLDLINEASKAPEVASVTVTFGNAMTVVKASDWQVGVHWVMANKDHSFIVIDRDEIKSVSILWASGAIANSMQRLHMQDVLPALKAANLKRERNQS